MLLVIFIPFEFKIFSVNTVGGTGFAGLEEALVPPVRRFLTPYKFGRIRRSGKISLILAVCISTHTLARSTAGTLEKPVVVTDSFAFVDVQIPGFELILPSSGIMH
jgi:hypothetical protein